MTTRFCGERLRRAALLFFVAPLGLLAAVPRSEYPQPQFQRAAWTSLNGSWQFEFDDANAGVRENWSASGHKFSRTITVPYCFESRLSGIEDTTFHPYVWYRRTFTVPPEWRRGAVLLHFGAVDYETQVWINGRLAGEHPPNTLVGNCVTLGAQRIGDLTQCVIGFPHRLYRRNGGLLFRDRYEPPFAVRPCFEPELPRAALIFALQPRLGFAFANPLGNPVKKQSRDAIAAAIAREIEQPQMHAQRFEAVDGAVCVLRSAKHAV